MLENVKCLFLEDFSGNKDSLRLELEHNRLRTNLNLSANLMFGLLLFMLFYISINPVSDVFALSFFGIWLVIFVGMLAAFEKMFKDIEGSL